MTDHEQTIRTALERIKDATTGTHRERTDRALVVMPYNRATIALSIDRAMASLTALQEHITTLEWAIGVKDKQILEFMEHETALQEERERTQADSRRLDWLNEQIVNVIDLDDGRIVDVRGLDVRAAIDAATGESAAPQEGRM